MLIAEDLPIQWGQKRESKRFPPCGGYKSRDQSRILNQGVRRPLQNYSSLLCSFYLLKEKNMDAGRLVAKGAVLLSVKWTNKRLLYGNRKFS